MQKIHDIKEASKEKVILVIVVLHQDKEKGWSPEEIHAEFKELVLSSGADVVDEVFAKGDEPTANYMIGKGKAEEIRDLVHSYGDDVRSVVFSENLSSTQQRNLEEVIGKKVIDRTQLILDIFSQRAHTNEGKLQVELAQLEYLLPRLSGLGIKLSRLGGGIGTRGPGEKMLETDRRGVRRRIKYVKNDLESLDKRRKNLRQNRLEHSVATVAIIGYTNAGKSTLLNNLTGSDVVADKRLFCTLDPTSRRYILPNKQKVLFVDTVGFIHKLPHNLIEAFKATLEEVHKADLLLHVLDISSQKAKEHTDAVYEVLKELDSRRKPMITALNKSDLVDNKYIIDRFKRDIPDSVVISAKEQKGFNDLIELVGRRIPMLTETIDKLIPYSNMAILNQIYEQGQVIERDDTPQGIRIKAIIPSYLKFRDRP